MTTTSPPRAQTPRLKASATSRTTSTPVSTFTSGNIGTALSPIISASTSAPAVSARPPLYGPRRSARPATSDYLSDKATAFFIRRVLCAQQLGDKGRATPAPIEELLPPLTSRNDVDLQFYAIIAVIIREFVQNWYTKITPDEEFVAEIVRLIAHCTRALEQRLRKVDLESLLFDELPDLLDRHILAYRASHNPMARPPIKTDPRDIYHSICPLPQLSPVPRPEIPSSAEEQERNEAAYRQLLVQGVLAVLLPTEDLENECLTSLVGQILSELIIGGVVAKKAAEPWLIWEGLIILARNIRQRTTEATGERDLQGSAAKLSPPGATTDRSFSTRGLFWSIIQWIFLAFTSLRLFVVALTMSPSLPSRLGDNMTPGKKGVPGTPGSLSKHRPSSATRELRQRPQKVPLLAFRLWPTVSNVIELDLRMPWLGGVLSMLQWVAMTGPGQVASLDGVIDRLMSHAIQQQVLDPAQLPTVLRALRGALFPNNAMGSPTMTPPSSQEELLALRRRCASAIWALVPRVVGRLYFGGGWAITPLLVGKGSSSSPLPLAPPRTGPPNSREGHSVSLSSSFSPVPSHSGAVIAGPSGGSGTSSSSLAISAAEGHGEKELGEEEEEERILAEIESGILDMFSDAYCNKHLMYSVVELFLVRLIPELTEKGIVDLLEERLT